MVDIFLSKFSPAETRKFLRTTAPRSRSRKIASLLSHNNTPLSKDELFFRVFRQKRNRQNDYLLRNELSILKKKLEVFLLQQSEPGITSGTVYELPYTVATWCLKNTLAGAAEKYARQALKIAVKSAQWQGALYCNKFLLQTIQYSKSNYEEKWEQMLALEKNHRQYTAMFIAEETRYADFIHAASYKMGANLRKIDMHFQLPEQVCFTIENSSTALSRFYTHKALAYASDSGSEAIQQMKKALHFLDKVHFMREKDHERIACMNMIATEYALMGNLTASEAMFVCILKDHYYPFLTGKNVVLFNYISTILKLKKYKEAAHYLELLESEENEPVIKERIYSMKCNCYIFLEDTVNIKRILPKRLNEYDLSLKIYYRLLYLVYYIINREYEMAQREITNLQKTKQLETTQYQPLLKLFERYLTAFLAIFYQEKNAKRKTEALQKEITLFLDTNTELVHMLPALWVTEKGKLLKH